MMYFIGIIKDKISLTKLTLTKPTTFHLHIAVLRTTTHSPSSPPKHHHLTTLTTLGNNSRATASTIITSLINRLHRTNNSSVALKCLITIHHIIKHGPFILKDQLIILSPPSNARNNFKLSASYDGTWTLSAWVRWYARYIETIIFTSKNTHFDHQRDSDTLSSLMNYDLIIEFGSLVGVIEEICNVPDNLVVKRDKLVYGVMELLLSDYLLVVNELLLRVGEFKERVELLSLNESSELVCVLDRLCNCKERLLELFSVKKVSVETLWEVIGELNKKVNGMMKF